MIRDYGIVAAIHEQDQEKVVRFLKHVIYFLCTPRRLVHTSHSD